MKLTVETIFAGIFFLLFQLALTGGYAGAEMNSEGVEQDYQMPSDPQADGEIVEQEGMGQLEEGIEPEAMEEDGAGEEVYLEDQDQAENESYGEIVEQLEEGIEPEVMESEGSQGEGAEVPAENEIEPEMLEEKPME